MIPIFEAMNRRRQRTSKRISATGIELLIPLAATSTKAIMRKLGRNWLHLHSLIYVISLLGVLHFLWQVKFGEKIFGDRAGDLSRRLFAVDCDACTALDQTPPPVPLTCRAGIRVASASTRARTMNATFGQRQRIEQLLQLLA